MDVRARQGYYIRAANEAAALELMRQQFPDADETFDIQKWF